MLHDILISWGGGQLRFAILAWFQQTFRASATTLGTFLSSFSAPTTTTGSIKAVSFPTWRVTRTLSLVRSTSTKPSRKVLSSWEALSCFCIEFLQSLFFKVAHFHESWEVMYVLALEEAARRFQELKAQRESREALEQERNSRKPPPYKFIKVLCFCSPDRKWKLVLCVFRFLTSSVISVPV